MYWLIVGIFKSKDFGLTTLLKKTVGHFCKINVFSKYWLFFEMGSDMDIASKIESHNVCICRNAFQTDRSRKSHSSHFSETL